MADRNNAATDCEVPGVDFITICDPGHHIPFPKVNKLGT